MLSDIYIKKKLKKQIFFSATALILYLAIFFVFSRLAVMVSARISYDTALAVKKNMLRDTVDNVFLSIDFMRRDKATENPSYTEEEIKEQVYKNLYRRIHSEHYEDGAYMWVSQVLNYDGGNDYAIRLIHPNLKNTEGSLLSTNTVNEDGSLAYADELAGVKKDGYVFLQYSFKKLNSEDVSEKIAYSRLYEDYDWIISMGINKDDVKHYMLVAEENIGHYRIAIYAVAIVIWAAFIIFLMNYYKKTEIGLYKEQNRALRDKLSFDTVTGAHSRDYGERRLASDQRKFAGGDGNTFIAILDIDRFKYFNDTYGHAMGDMALKRVVDIIRECTRTSDAIIRWGGDEFVIAFSELSEKMVPTLGNKILDSIRKIDLSGDGIEESITISMGFSNFKERDKSYMDAIYRADEALYRAKEMGRDCWSV